MKKYFKGIYLPILAFIYPVIFIYNNNINVLRIKSVEKPLFISLLMAILVYSFFYLIFKHKSDKASLASLIFLLFFYSYGLIFDTLYRVDLIHVEHYTLLPFMIVLACYVAAGVSAFLKAKPISIIQQAAVIIVGGLIIFNLIGIIPDEIQKAKVNRSSKIENSSLETQSTCKSTKGECPDIYYFVFDEFAGFNSIKEYWHYDEIDNFINLLESKGFFVAERSSSPTIDTLIEMASRLNFEQYETGKGVDFYFSKIKDNLLFNYLKGKGYTTVVFDESRASFAYPAKPTITADFSYEYDPNSMGNSSISIDDFEQMFLDMTMLRPLSERLKQDNQIIVNHENMIYYTMDKVCSLEEIQSPRIVYVHLMLPHMPFIFDENGKFVDPKYQQNWNYYLGNYIYTTKLINKLLINLSESSDPAHPPVIIIQSDHGARNKKTGHPDSVNFNDFPEEYKHDIMFAINIPGYDYSSLPKTIDPINTFPIVLNYYFDAGLKLK